MHDGSLGKDFGEGVGAEVRPVVGEDLIDGHVVGPEPPLGLSPELDEGGRGLVVVGFDVGDAGVVVDRDVQMGVADLMAFGAFGLRRAASVDSPAAAWGILPTLLMSRSINLIKRVNSQAADPQITPDTQDSVQSPTFGECSPPARPCQRCGGAIMVRIQ